MKGFLSGLPNDRVLLNILKMRFRLSTVFSDRLNSDQLFFSLKIFKCESENFSDSSLRLIFESENFWFPFF